MLNTELDFFLLIPRFILVPSGGGSLSQFPLQVPWTSCKSTEVSRAPGSDGLDQVHSGRYRTKKFLETNFFVMSFHRVFDLCDLLAYTCYSSRVDYSKRFQWCILFSLSLTCSLWSHWLELESLYPERRSIFMKLAYYSNF